MGIRLESALGVALVLAFYATLLGRRGFLTRDELILGAPVLFVAIAFTLRWSGLLIASAFAIWIVFALLPIVAPGYAAPEPEPDGGLR